MALERDSDRHQTGAKVRRKIVIREKRRDDLYVCTTSKRSDCVKRARAHTRHSLSVFLSRAFVRSLSLPRTIVFPRYPCLHAPLISRYTNDITTNQAPTTRENLSREHRLTTNKSIRISFRITRRFTHLLFSLCFFSFLWMSMTRR